MKGFRRTSEGYYESLDGRFVLSREPAWLLVDNGNEVLDRHDQPVAPAYPCWSLGEVTALIEELRGRHADSARAGSDGVQE